MGLRLRRSGLKDYSVGSRRHRVKRISLFPQGGRGFWEKRALRMQELAFTTPDIKNGRTRYGKVIEACNRAGMFHRRRTVSICGSVDSHSICGPPESTTRSTAGD